MLFEEIFYLGPEKGEASDIEEPIRFGANERLYDIETIETAVHCRLRRQLAGKKSIARARGHERV